MADKQLTSNVQVDGNWYGPSYPQNEVTQAVLDQITNPAAFEQAGGGVDLRTTAADFGVEEGEQPHVRSLDAAPGATAPFDMQVRRTDLTSAPSVADVASGPTDAGGATTGAPAKSASKADWVAYAVAQGADPTEAEAANKDDLVARYGG